VRVRLMLVRRMRNALWVPFVLEFVGSCGGGSGPSSAVSHSGVPLGMTSGQNALAAVDTNAGKYSYVEAYQFEAWGGSPQSGYTWTVSTGSTLPLAGLSLAPLTGVLTGTPPSGTAPGDYPFSITVSDGSSTYSSMVYVHVVTCNSDIGQGMSDSSNCSGGGYPPPLMEDGGVNLTAFLPNAPKPGEPFGISLWVSGGVPPYQNWTVTGGSVPPGLTLDQDRGVLWGTPFSSASGTTYSFSVSVSDSAGDTAPGATYVAAPYSLAVQ